MIPMVTRPLPPACAAHCWHRAPQSYNNGVQELWRETCCRCGHSRQRTRRLEPDPAHGPWVQVERWVTDDPPEEPA